MEYLQALAQIFKDLGAGNTVIFSLIVMFGFVIWHYLTKIYPANKAERERRLSEQEEANLLLRESINNNNVVVRNLERATDKICNTLSEMSNRLSSHDERSINLTTLVNQQTQAIMTLVERMPTNDALVRVHDRLDHFGLCTADKGDINQICAAISKLDQNLAKANEGIAEIKGRSSS